MTIPASLLALFTRSNEAVTLPLPAVEEAYRAGRSYHLNGLNAHNCDFRLFATPEHMRAWEKGKDDAAAGM